MRIWIAAGAMALVCGARAPRAEEAPATPAPAPEDTRREPGAARVSTTSIDLTALPERCRAVAKQAVSPRLAEALPARVTLAGCIAESEIAKLDLLDCQDSVLAVDDATAPSFALLGGVIAAGDPAQQLLAEHARAELYLGMIARMTATVPPPTGGEAGRALHQSRTELLEALLVPWRAHASDAYERVLALAQANPQLGRNLTAQAAVRKSRLYLAAHPRPVVAEDVAAPQDPYE